MDMLLSPPVTIRWQSNHSEAVFTSDKQGAGQRSVCIRSARDQMLSFLSLWDE